MSTHDYVIANASGSSVRSDLNNALAAIVSNNSSSSEPSTKYAYMLWADTTNNLIKLRNSANNAWITLFTTAGGLDVDAASNFNEDVTFTGASANVTWDKSADDFIFNDNAKAAFGTSSDLSITHDGTDSTIYNNTGNLLIYCANDFYLKHGTEVMLAAKDDAAVELYYDGVNRFATLNYGAIVYGIGEIQGDVANNYVNHTFNDGNSATRYGSYIKCGTDDASGTNYALGVSDGNGTTQGYLTFSGGTLSLVAFTASHPCIIPDADNPSDDSMAYPYGTLLETISIEYSKSKKDGSDTERGIRYKVQKTQSANSKKVLGAYAGSMNGGPDGQTNEHDAYVLGDGHILVNNAGGNIEVGDGICSSATAGIGQKATANPSMIIGIAQEAITFTGSETKLVAVQYGLQQFIPWS